jgi:hypothetical protein
VKLPKRHVYVVGWDDSPTRGKTVYGKSSDGNLRWIDALTIQQARKKLSELGPCMRTKRTIFELVPVEFES